MENWILLGFYIVYLFVRFCELYKNNGKKIQINNRGDGNKHNDLLYQISINNIKDYKDRIFSFSYHTILLYGVLFGIFSLISNKVDYVIFTYHILVILASFYGVCLIIKLQYDLCKERARSTAFGGIFKESLPDYDINERELERYGRYSYDPLLYIYLSSNIVGLMIVYFMPYLI
jgi:hypothetical protein